MVKCRKKGITKKGTGKGFNEKPQGYVAILNQEWGTFRK